MSCNIKKEDWRLEWYWDEELELLTIHVYPHRSFLIIGAKYDEAWINCLAGLLCFNVMLGQNEPIHAMVDSVKLLPKELTELADHLKSVSKGKFVIEYINTGSVTIFGSREKRVLLFSGGKDSLWQLNHLEQQDIVPLFVSGATIALEYVKELATVKKCLSGRRLEIMSIENMDYSNIGLNFKFRARWRALILICLARMSSDEIWTGISKDNRFITHIGLSEDDELNFFSETPGALEILARILNCNIWLAPSESYTFFEIEQSGQNYRSCYSPDIICTPETDFVNSCWKCRAELIYRKIRTDQELTDEERKFFNSSNWVGDALDEIKKNARGEGAGDCVCKKGKIS